MELPENENKGFGYPSQKRPLRKPNKYKEKRKRLSIEPKISYSFLMF